MWFVYVLLSNVDNRTYIGSTKNIQLRIGQHNQGMVVATRSRRPLKLIYNEEYATEGEARNREHFLKTTSGRRELKKILASLGL
jgi:putative endonuclease